MGIQLERRTESTAQLMTEVDVLATVAISLGKGKQSPEGGMQKLMVCLVPCA